MSVSSDVLTSGKPGEESDEPDGPGSPPAGRRRSVPAVLAAVLAGVVLAGGGWLASGGWPIRDTPRQPESAPAPTRVGPPDGDQLIEVRFADADHGYALGGRCVAAQPTCGYTLRSTADGGRTWRGATVPLPALTPPDGYSAELTVLGPTSVLVEEKGRRYFSADRGTTWRPAPERGTERLATVPSGWSLTDDCRDEQTACPESAATIDPVTGRLTPLTSQPDLRARVGGDRPPGPVDGSLWIAGTDPDTGLPAVAVSRDRGRTWRTVRLAAPTTTLFGVSLITRDGRTGYAFVRAQPPAGTDGKNGLDSIWRTTDGGANWTRVPSRALPPTALGVAMLPDGHLLLTTEAPRGSNVWESVDGGITFTRRPTGPSLAWINEAGGRYTAGGFLGGYWTSTDGVRWTEL